MIIPLVFLCTFLKIHWKIKNSWTCFKPHLKSKTTSDWTFNTQLVLLFTNQLLDFGPSKLMPVQLVNNCRPRWNLSTIIYTQWITHLQLRLQLWFWTLVWKCWAIQTTKMSILSMTGFNTKNMTRKMTTYLSLITFLSEIINVKLIKYAKYIINR